MFRYLLIGLAATLVVAASCMAYGFLIEPKRLFVREVLIESPAARAPLRVGLLADIHGGGRHVYARKVREVVEAVGAASPDIILIAGDFTVGSPAYADRSAGERAAIDAAHAELARLDAPLGVYAVLGNHDHTFGASLTRTRMERLGLRMIDNAVVDLGEVCVIGLADEWHGRPDPTVERDCPDDRTRLVVAHNPDTLFELRRRHALLVAGHTHGGQINIPVLGRRVTATRAGRAYAYGAMTIAGSPAFVTAGVGTSVLPARFRAPPEVVLIDLRPSPATRPETVPRPLDRAPP